MSLLDRFHVRNRLWPLVALLALGGCSFSLIDGKGVDKLGKIVREAVYAMTSPFTARPI